MCTKGQLEDMIATLVNQIYDLQSELYQYEEMLNDLEENEDEN